MQAVDPASEQRGNFVGPHIVTGVRPDSRMAQERSSGRSWLCSGLATSMKPWPSPTEPHMP